MPLKNINFKTFFETVPGLYLILLPDLKIAEASNEYLKATMTLRDNIIGRDLFDVFPDNPEDLAADGVSNLRASLTTVLRTGQAHAMAVQKYDIRRPDGTFEERYWSPLNKPVLRADGSVQYIIHRAEDVTEFILAKKEQEKREQINAGLRERIGQMEMEIYQRAAEIQQANQQLEYINAELEAFSYSVSHDLKAPLRAISGYVRMLSEDYGNQLGDEGDRLISRITTNVSRMGLLIDELLAFSKLGRKHVQRSNINMAALTEKVVGELVKNNHKAKIRIGGLGAVEGDQLLIYQVMFNLVSNAIKYSSKKDKPEVEIFSESREKEMVFSVKDNGAGFDMSYAGKLFRVFERLHSQNDFEGVGVGLALVKRIVEKHGGKVWAHGAENEGAVFSFSLPHQLQENAVPADAAK